MLDEKDIETIRKVVREEASGVVKAFIQAFAETMAREIEKIKKLEAGPK